MFIHITVTDFSSYLIENTMPLYYKDRSVDFNTTDVHRIQSVVSIYIYIYINIYIYIYIVNIEI